MSFKNKNEWFRETICFKQIAITSIYTIYTDLGGGSFMKHPNKILKRLFYETHPACFIFMGAFSKMAPISVYVYRSTIICNHPIFRGRFGTQVCHARHVLKSNRQVFGCLKNGKWDKSLPQKTVKRTGITSSSDNLKKSTSRFWLNRWTFFAFL